jgi:hypothetical protein
MRTSLKRNAESDASRNPMVIALAGVAKTNAATAPAKVWQQSN